MAKWLPLITRPRPLSALVCSLVSLGFYYLGLFEAENEWDFIILDGDIGGVLGSMVVVIIGFDSRVYT